MAQLYKDGRPDIRGHRTNKSVMLCDDDDDDDDDEEDGGSVLVSMAYQTFDFNGVLAELGNIFSSIFLSSSFLI